ncbi:PAS domain S-box protein [Roseateles sp. GG27B]
MRESEARYRALFESIDEGFCVIEMLFDAQNKALDYRFLELNPAFEKHTGLHAATGKRMLELNPEHEANWFEIYGQVALSGEPIRFTNQAKGLGGRWFDVYALRLGGPESSRVALLFRDITAAKDSEDSLRESNEELTTFNLVAVGRELRMIELKREINSLCALLGQPARFALASDEQADLP